MSQTRPETISPPNNVVPLRRPPTMESAARAPLEPPEEAGTQVENILERVVAAFTEMPEWRGVFGWNEFAQRIAFRKAPPFPRDGYQTDELQDEDVAHARLWFEREMGKTISAKNVVDALAIVARGNRYHPVRDYLNALTWDGKSRVATWLEKFCSVKPTSTAHRKLVRAVSSKWLVSCVARAMTPGCKVDTMLIFEGKQGAGKSRALRALAGDEFFNDSPIDFRTKDALQAIQGVWIYELAELDAILRGESTATKAFLSRPVDRFRPPYGRVPVTVPRSVVFCGSVNHTGYLTDPTGNRRFWIVRCDGSLDVDGLRANRDQLWAEARVLFERGEPWHLTPDEEALMRVEHEDRIEDDPWEERIGAWVAAQGKRPIAIDDLLDGGLGIRAASRKPTVTRRVHAILEQLGFERQRRSFEPGKPRVYRYVRPASDASLPYCPTAPTETSTRDSAGRQTRKPARHTRGA